MKYFSPHDSIDCGPACLKMIATSYGKNYSIHYLRKISYLNRQGVSIFNLGKAAETLGFKTLIGELSVNYLVEKATLPSILFWDKDHFVVLYKISKKRGKVFFYIADPGRGKVRLDEETFKSYWIGEGKKGFALFIEPTPAFYAMNEVDSIKNKKSPIQFLSHYFLTFRKNYIQVVISMALAVLISLLFPFLTQSIVDFGVDRKDMNFIALILLFQLFIFVTGVISDIIRSQLLTHISARINISILADYLTKMMRLPMKFFESKMPGDLVQRMQDHRIIEDFITTTLLTTIFTLINLLVFSGVLFYYNKLIFAIFLIGSCLSVSWTLLFMKRRRALNYWRFRELSNANDKLFEMVNNMPEIKVNRFEKFKQWEWQEVQVKLFKVDVSTLSLDQFQRIGADFFDQVRTILIMFFAASSVVHGEFTLGAMLAISYVVGQLNVSIKELVRFINNFQGTVIALERMNEVYTEPIEERESQLTEESTIQRGFRGLEFRNLSFGYMGPHHDKVLKNIDLKIPEGKITAIVGSSGSGKTTMLKLLLKFYAPDGGEIILNGRNLESYSSEWWRDKCGTVMQEGHIFSDTIKRNVVMSDESNDNARLVNSVEAACIGDFILELPLHFDTKIGDAGLGMSTGQKQRILIARAIYKNPEFLFFDEATSSLDAQNERTIMENLDKFFVGKTVIIIAHRLSTVRNADQIVVLNKGEIVEIGNHDELVRLRGFYYNLVKNQLELGD